MPALSSRAWDLSYWAAVFGTAVLTLVAVIASISHPLLGQPDQCMYLSMADLLMAGRLPYVDCFDNNPPLIIYLSVIPMVVARLAALPATLAFALCVHVLAALSAGLSFWLLRSTRGKVSGLLACLSVLVFAWFNAFQEMDLGQREHIFTLAVFPYLLLRFLRYRLEPDLSDCDKVGAISACLTGLLAGVGISLKHYFLFIVLMVELACFLRRPCGRSLLHLEVATCLAAITLYLLHFLFLPPSMLSGFFGFVLPIYARGYDYYTNSFLFNLATYWRPDFLQLGLVSLLALFLAAVSFEITGLLSLFLTFAWSSALVFFLAGQAWQYHLLPVRLGTCLTLSAGAGLLLVCLLRRREKYFSWVFVFVCLTIACHSALTLKQRLQAEEEQHEHFDMAFLGHKGTCFDYEVSPAVATIIANTRKTDTVLFISTAMAPGYPSMIQTERRPGSRFIHAMPLVVLDYVVTSKSGFDRPRFQKMEEQVLSWYGEDIAGFKPRLIFIQVSPMAGVLEKLNFQKRFLGAYELIGEDFGMQIWRRKD